MNFCAVISEFNPFHNGHQYLLKKAKEITNLPCVCLMSGDFVQRGEPAIVDKYTRAKSAISCGADAVIELPTVYSLSCAQSFAKGSIKILKELKCTHLVIGVTYANLDDYYELVKIKNTNIKAALKTELNNGENYSKALISVLKLKFKNCDKIFSDASNILALEYIEQIITQNAKMQIILVARTDKGYNSSKAINEYANATTIRGLLLNNKTSTALKYIPSSCSDQFNELPNTAKINDILFYNLRNQTAETLTNYYDYTEGLPYLISSAALSCPTYDQMITAAVCKRYRLARIKKLSIYPSLNMTKTNVEKIESGKIVAKLLAIKKQSKALINFFNKTYIKIIVSNNDYTKLNKTQSLSANIDLMASNLYSIANNKQFNNDIKVGTLFID